MGLGRTYSVALVGLNGYIVEVEADIGQTLPAFVIQIGRASCRERV